MLFDIAYLCVLFNIEGVDAVMLGRLISAVVDPAARHDRNICAFPDIKIVVYKIL